MNRFLKIAAMGFFIVILGMYFLKKTKSIDSLEHTLFAIYEQKRSEQETQELLKNLEKLAKTGDCTGCNLNARKEDADLTVVHQAIKSAQSKGLTINLMGANLSMLDLTNADLRNVNLTGAELTGVNLTGANLSGANLSGTRINLSKLVGANLTNAKITGAKLVGCDLKDAIVDGADFQNADIDSIYPGDVDFSKANITGTSFKYTEYLKL